MTKVVLLQALKEVTIEATGDLLLPVAHQKEDREPPADRAAEVYRMRIPDGKAAKKKAPYVLHQIITGKDVQPSGGRPEATAMVRSIFCVYHPDEQEGGLALLNLMERLRFALLERGTIGNQFRLDTDAGIESLVYPEDTAPYYAGEMISTWKLPAVERKVTYGKEGDGHIQRSGPGPDCTLPGAVHRFYGAERG